jgi:hypothetical protein
MSIHQTYELNELMHRYALLRAELRKEGIFPELWDPIPVTEMTSISPDGVGYNVGKGYEIFICTDGPINSIMHVFIHELSHNTVTEYDHNGQFWDNFEKLKDVAKKIGIYHYTQPQMFCGGKIGD